MSAAGTLFDALVGFVEAPTTAMVVTPSRRARSSVSFMAVTVLPYTGFQAFLAGQVALERMFEEQFLTSTPFGSTGHPGRIDGKAEAPTHQFQNEASSVASAAACRAPIASAAGTAAGDISSSSVTSSGTVSYTHLRAHET